MIKNLLFDFGDIFINLDKSATLNTMKQFGLHQVTPEMNEINNQYEKGEISSIEFIAFYKSLFPRASEKDLEGAWNDIILDFPEYRLSFIEELTSKEEFNLFLLSNTNELHIKKVKENMNNARYDRFKKCFQKFYLSHEIGMRKPDHEIYKYVLKENNLKAEETLFIDDTPENIIAASALNIQTWNLEPGVDDVVDLFKNPIFSA
ncbi:HAD family hydrolase [Spongiivirga citrea]|uniref:HAD-IA family hydrolase n=1 Tax=Spongiivirga citrea TaxID=1481457 RepID=A0A6M0CCZ4_9FLAO|nr:HAD family phosphatase [Spongiivirga citrea]NER15655.1 HAD-IA family hydrolase [Spongiivirga citrea]